MSRAAGEPGGLHVAPWSVYLEVVGDDGTPLGPEEEGEIVATSLTNYAMPLMRYAIGDRGAITGSCACACGHTGVTLRRVSGRIVDTFRAPTGELVDGEYFTHLLYHLEWVTKFQVLQRDHEHVVFRIVPTRIRRAPDDDLSRITAGVRKALSPACRVDFEFVPELLPGPSGKFHYTISEFSEAAS